MLVLPVPVVIRENGPEWRWLVWREHGVGWPLGLTLANYELMAGPLLFVAFFLATAPTVRPLTRRARTICGRMPVARIAGWEQRKPLKIGSGVHLMTISGNFALMHVHLLLSMSENVCLSSWPPLVDHSGRPGVYRTSLMPTP